MPGATPAPTPATTDADPYHPKPPAPPVPLPQEKNPSALDIAQPAVAGAIGSDIAKILGEIKLPERRTPSGARPPIENKASAIDAELSSAISQEQPSHTSTESAQAPAHIAQASNVMPRTPEAAARTPPAQHTGDITGVHTLRDDLQTAVRDEKMSLVRAASFEQDRRAHSEPKGDDLRKEAAQRRSRRIAGILFASVLLLVLGAAALFGVYSVMQAQSGNPMPATSSSILFAEQSVAFPIDNQSPDQLKQTLAQARDATQAALGSIIEVIPTVSTTTSNGTVATRPATFEEFMNAIGAHPPADLYLSLSSQFFFGFHTVDTEAPLFVIPVLSYDHAFADMLAWEPAMNADLAPIFTPVPAMTTNASGLPVARTFQDDVMHNYDVRELKNDAGQVVLYYSFPTQKILVIAQSPYSFTEILSRLQAAREL